MNETEIKRQIQLSNYLWRNRRRMAWGAFVSILIVTFLCFFVVDIERLKQLETVVTWFYMAMASIVGAYMGLATYASVSGGENPWSWNSGQNYQQQDHYPPSDAGVTPDNPDEPPRRRLPKSPMGHE